jgi:hypothetical protein
VWCQIVFKVENADEFGLVGSVANRQTGVGVTLSANEGETIGAVSRPTFPRRDHRPVLALVSALSSQLSQS